jgi:predicted Zn-dependent protease with MMP-like domain
VRYAWDIPLASRCLEVYSPRPRAVFLYRPSLAEYIDDNDGLVDGGVVNLDTHIRRLE